jgi:hypothetical protein
MNWGKLIIIFTLVAAAGMAGAGVWYFHRQSNRVIDTLSPQVAMLITYAPSAQVARLTPPAAANAQANPAEIVRVQGHAYWVVDRHDVLAGKDFSDVRSWLIHNDNYDWTIAPAIDAGSWQFDLTFFDGPRRAELLFDIPGGRMLLLPENTILSVRPMVDGLQAFFVAQFPPAGVKAAPPE